jgi:putative DNA methylase
MSHRKKLIEVALPLDAINKAATTEKSIRHGHPSTLHLWWARRPLATCRAVLFASLIDDPSEHPEQFPTEEEQDNERKRLFKLIEDVVDWKNIHNEKLLEEVRVEIDKATNGNSPPVLDPFAGGGSIPLEAQRLGLEAHASDLNPVAVLINKALIEIPPKFANRPPVSFQGNQLFKNQTNDWQGAHGLAEDIRHYGKWIRDEAEKRIGHLYPKVKLPDGSDATVIAWIWTRTVTCPNPACGVQMPLVRSFVLSKKKTKEAWVEPVINHTVTPSGITFAIKTGQGKPQDSTISKRGARCIVCGTTSPLSYIRSEAQNGKMGTVPLAIIAEGHKSRVYLAPDSIHEKVAGSAQSRWKPEELVTTPSHDVDRLPMYGMYTWGDAFTPRQLVALTTFSDLIQEVRQRVLSDAMTTDLTGDTRPLHAGGCGALAYADAVTTYLAIIADKGVDYWSALCSWHNGRDTISHTFTKQALQMVWDLAEANPFSESSGNFTGAVNWAVKVVEATPSQTVGYVNQRDATMSVNGVAQPLISTDPPYYDNVGYANLSDFFYVWLRRSLAGIYPDLFHTMLVPKKQELVADPYRFGGDKSQAQAFFESGLGKAFERMRQVQHPDYPLTVYYAFKQSETDVDSDEVAGENENGKGNAVVASTGWETMLEGLIRAGFTITGTWPMRTEMMNRSVGQGTNALASSIVLVCRPRPIDAPVATRREFLLALKKELPEALRNLQHGGIAPVDLAQASIGPGMSIYSRYSQVVESDNTPLRVRTALQMINQELDAALAEQEGEYDRETRWAIAWFEQYGMEEGGYGVAETLSKAKNMSVAHLENAKLVVSKAGKVRLCKREELPDEWIPRNNTVWEVAQRMIYAIHAGKGVLGGGEVGAANILRQVLSLGESVRDLAYRLYTVCERQGWTQEAQAYNGLITSWTQITNLAHKESGAIQQESLF